MAPSMVSAQNSNDNATGNDLNNAGGLSPESVDLATSNGTNQALNTTDSSNNAGGLSPESVDLATSNGTNQALNTTDSSNNTGGLSPESVTEAKY
ncbi:hypothetical protein [Candidatus Nitrosocosmicus sp. SS]|uniref:hypothetical protein n=1 Tax=Candidatus Nitrosocosmicus agrestis TaxID=2563600 RepID=UPI00122E5282|nr:hypothetical protein [Candidatus Nitrosocosmicus sp. SS]KAF0868822.1 hypothetical protein E5N71_07395 [Candidatus Nitrosocosmicus sp. SS]